MNTQVCVESLYSAGVRLAEGRGVQVDKCRADLLIRRAAGMGHTGAAYALGLAAFNKALDALGENDDETKIATEQRLRSHIHLLDHAARNDQPGAWYILGLMHGYGLGVKKDRRIAADYFRIWRNCGPSAEEMYNLGMLYSDGNGFPLDNSEANRLFVRAANEGYAKAQYKLAERTWEGMTRHWDPDDVACEVAYWLECAAELGHADARRHLEPGYRLVRFCAVVAKRCDVQLHWWLEEKRSKPCNRLLRLCAGAADYCSDLLCSWLRQRW